MSGLVDKVRAGARSWGLLAGALVLGLMAFAMSAWYLQRRQVAIENELMGQQGERRQVVVALTELKPGVVISSQNMAVGEVPVKHLSAAAVTPEEFKMFDGKVLTSAMSEGEILLNHFVSGIGAERFSDLLTEGERAVTIQVDEVKSNENMLIFGDRVDLLLLTEQADENDSLKKNKVLNPLVENVRVLAVGRHALATRDADLASAQSLDGLAYSTLTVGVTVDDASRLLLGRDLGTIVVMMRNRADTKALDGRLLDRAGLLAGGSSGRRGGFEFFSGSQLESGTLRAQIRPYVRARAPAPESGTAPANGETSGPPVPAPTAAVAPPAPPTGAP
ncbi:MAG TPA: Flp pilus assembly protein CpaB [Tahibacter sp.]|nr:Flp pilus assembly protein CpaB [Tahibacter sp.]